MSKGVLLSARNLHKVYKTAAEKIHVLKGIDISVSPGEMVAVVGPSGAGKSTLLNILGGLDSPSEGNVFFEGTDLYDIGERERALLRNRRIGFVFQSYHLLAEFTALENVMMPAVMRFGKGPSLKEAKRRALGLLDAVGISERAHHVPAELSGGEAQRAAIARALMNEPDIIYCDEPTGNLDSASSERVLELIIRLNKKNKQAFLIVSHNEDIMECAQRTLRIKDGYIFDRQKGARAE